MPNTDFVLSDHSFSFNSPGAYATVFSNGHTYLMSGHFSSREVQDQAEAILKAGQRPLSCTIYQMHRALKWTSPPASPAPRQPTLLDVAKGKTLHLVNVGKSDIPVVLTRPFVIQVGQLYGSIRVRRIGDELDKSELFSVSISGLVEPRYADDHRTLLP